MTEVRFSLRDKVGLRGPETTIVLENPDPHPQALRKLAVKFAASKTAHRWERCYIHYNNQIITLLLEE